jgi:RHS repeat-associated protein
LTYLPISPDRSQPLHGQRLDATGLYYYNARYYDATIGRFISADTVIQSLFKPQTLNRYSYCLNNPLKYIDPTGHDILGIIQNDVWAAILGGFLGYTIATYWSQHATDALNAIAIAMAGKYSYVPPKYRIPIPEPPNIKTPSPQNMDPSGKPPIKTIIKVVTMIVGGVLITYFVLKPTSCDIEDQVYDPSQENPDNGNSSPPDTPQTQPTEPAYPHLDRPDEQPSSITSDTPANNPDTPSVTIVNVGGYYLIVY